MRGWAEAIEAYTDRLVAAGIRPRTIVLRRCQLRRLAAAHLRRSPWRVTDADLVGWLAAQPWAPETRKSYRSALRGFYRWAQQTGRTRQDPAAALPPVRVAPAPPRPTPDIVLEQALDRASDRDRLIITLAGYAGLRRAEIAGLRWADIDLDGSPASIRVRGKGGRVRIIPIHPVLAGELGKERIRRDDGGRGSGYRYTAGDLDAWVFPGRSGGPMSPGAVGEAAARALGGGWTGHTLRHRFLTRVYWATRDLLIAQELAGHASPETTRRYTAVRAEHLVDAVHQV